MLAQLNDDRRPTLPTNGVVMVATEVGLRPKKIIIAEWISTRILQGRYPGGSLGDNNYPQMHSREVEVQALGSVLAQFSGETTILSKPLSTALAAHRLQARIGTRSAPEVGDLPPKIS